MANKKNEVAPTTPQTPALDLGSLEQFKAGKGQVAEGLEVVDRSDIKLPKIKLVQSTSAEAQKGKCQAGHYMNLVTGETYPELDCYLLVLGKTRVMWKKPFKRGEEPLCRSFDGKIKWDGSKSCATCEYQDWSKIKEGENKPACNMGYTWLGVTQEGKSPFRLIASGASVSPTKDFLNTILPNKLPAFAYKVRLGSEQQENDQGIFYVITYEITGTVTPEEFVKLQETATGMRDMFMNAMQTEMENIKAGEGDGELSDDAEKQGGMF